MRFYNYLNEFISKSLHKELNRKERPNKWMIVDKNGEVINTPSNLKTYTMAIKIRKWLAKHIDYDYELEDLYIADIKNSSDNKLKIAYIPGQDKPNFNFEYIS